MQLTVTKTIVDEKYIVKFDFGDFSTIETEMFVKFGEPSVEMGGTFTVAGSTWTMEQGEYEVKSDFPVEVVFDTRDNVNAEMHANNYINEIKSRAFSSVNVWKTNLDNFTGEEVVSL